MPKSLYLLGLMPLLAACVEMDSTAAASRPIDASPAALAALPAGIDPGFLIKDADGCYGIVLEVPPEGQPATGPALLDASGQKVCDGGAGGGIGVLFTGAA